MTRVPRWEAVLLAVGFIAFVVLAWFFPRSGDDWSWAVEGRARLGDFFAGYNGRYAGDLLIMALMTSRLLAVVVVGAIVCVTIFLALHLSRNRTPLGYALLGFLYLAMPIAVWRQSVVWLSGFANYATGALVVLIFWWLAQAESCGRLSRVTKPRLAAVVLAAIVGQLFMEHVTLCLLFLSVGVTVLFRVLNGRFPPYLSAWASGAVVGTIVMFSNSAYRHAASGGSAYQSTSSSFHDVLIKATDYIPTNVIVLNTAMNAVIFAAAMTIALAKRHESRSWWLLAAAASGYWALTLMLRHVDQYRSVLDGTNSFALVAALLAVAVLLLASRMIAPSDPIGASVIAFGLVAVTFLSGPLMVVNPLGPRCFYPSYIVLLAITSVLGRAAIEAAPAVARTVVTPALMAGTAVLGVALLMVYVDISHAVDHRVHRVRVAADRGREQVTLKPLPHSDRVHDANPYWSGLVTKYERYYGISSDIRINLSPNPWLRTATNPTPAIP